MPIVDYPFQAQGPFDEPSPILPINILNPDNDHVYPTWGLVDTGSDSTIIPGHVATDLGHIVKDGKRFDGYTGSGATDVYEHSCFIEILKMNEDGHVYDIVVANIPDRGKYIGVMENCPYVILGVKDFLKKYVLTIDYHQQVFSIRKPTRKKTKKRTQRHIRSSP